MDTWNGGGSAASAHAAWLRRSGYFREVLGYAEAVDLLNDPRLHANMVSTLEPLGVTSGSLWEVAAASLLSLNGAEHRRQRSLVAHRFTPKEAERVRPAARAAAHNLVTEFETTGSCELVSEFATPYVRTSTCHFVGFPEDEVATLWRALELLEGATKDHRVLGARDQQVLLELTDYAAEILDRRRVEPRDDILTVVAEECVRGSLPELAALGLVVALLSAGHQPTIKQLGISVSVLASRPEVWDALGKGDLEPAGVVEALLRYRSTNQAVMRQVLEPFECRGVTFEKGDAILVNLAAANHDGRRFDDPDRFDPVSSRVPHLSFGFGPHHCLGAALARVQLQEALAVLTKRLTSLEVRESIEDEGPGLIGPTSLNLRFSRRK